MKINAEALANAATFVTLIVYVVCWALSILAPDFLFLVSRNIFHSFDPNVMRSRVFINFRGLIIGSVIVSLLTWLTTYLTVIIYNRSVK